MARRDRKRVSRDRGRESAFTQRNHEPDEPRCSAGALEEVDEGGVRFRPRKPVTPTDHPELADEPKRGLDPPRDPPKIDYTKHPRSTRGDR